MIVDSFDVWQNIFSFYSYFNTMSQQTANDKIWDNYGKVIDV